MNKTPKSNERGNTAWGLRAWALMLGCLGSRSASASLLAMRHRAH